MPNRIPVPGPVPAEESRQLAEAIADLHYTMATIVEGAKELIPGESVEELMIAWEASEASADSMHELVKNLTDPQPQPPIFQSLVQGQLTGPFGKVKRSTLGRLKDRFFMFWNSQPRTDEKRVKSADAASDYLEFGATVVSSIPGYEKVEELLALGKQLIGCRAKRGI